LAGAYGLIEGAGNFASNYFVSDINGRANISVDVFSGDVSAVNYVVWDALDGKGSITLSSSCPAINPQPIIVKRPQLCKIKGKVTVNKRIYGGIIVSAAVSSDQVFPYSSFYYVFGATNDEGVYSIDLACGIDYQLMVGAPQDRNFPSVNVNNTLGASELSDDGKLVWVEPIDVYFPATNIYLPENPRSTSEGKLTFVGALNAFPINYNLQVINAVTGQKLASVEGSLPADTRFNWYIETDWLGWASGLGELEQNFSKKGSGQIPIAWALPLDISNIRLQGAYTDARGNKTNVDKELLATWVLYDFSLGH
jgi:hypothetical protein